MRRNVGIGAINKQRLVKEKLTQVSIINIITLALRVPVEQEPWGSKEGKGEC